MFSADPTEQRLLTRVAAVLLLLGSSACVQSEPPGVQVKAIERDITLGGNPTPAEAIPALALPPATAGFSGPALDAAGATQYEPPPRRTRQTRPTVPAVADCPAPRVSAFPAKAATFEITEVPVPGAYRWKRTVRPPSPGGLTSTQVIFNSHQIDGVSRITEVPNPTTPGQSTRTFSFDDIAFFDDWSSATTFQVTDNAPQLRFWHPSTGGGWVNAGGPDRGVAITKSVVRNRSGQQLGVAFRPSSPVLVLPLPVGVPMTFDSVGVDATTGASLAIRGTVIGTARVDACGDVVDGWRVESVQAFTASDGRRYVSDVDYVVATQLGGIVIHQESVTSEAVRAAGDLTVTDHLAQLRPTPVP